MKQLLSIGNTSLRRKTGELPNWHDVTRRETIEGAETAINGSVEHFSKKLEAIKGPKVVKTFE
jgi:hypothetical protein